MNGRRWAELFGELKRRRVFRVVLAYAGVAFLVRQVAEISFPALGIPSWALSLVVVLSALGLPLAVVLAWAFDITSQGVVRTRSSHSRATPTDEERERFAAVQNAFEEALRADESRQEADLERIAPHPDIRAEVLEMLDAHRGDGALDELAASLEASSSLGGGYPDVGTRFGHYTLLERLGSGGMGVVYRAEDARLDRMVALKFLAPSLGADPTAKQRFLAEARAAAALDHPNICTILEVGEIDGQLFIAMPYYEGRTVKELLRGGALGAAMAVPVAIQVGRGLAPTRVASSTGMSNPPT